MALNSARGVVVSSRKDQEPFRGGMMSSSRSCKGGISIWNTSASSLTAFSRARFVAAKEVAQEEVYEQAPEDSHLLRIGLQ
jgi:hypothetical protein